MIRYEDIARAIQVRHLQVGLDDAVSVAPSDDPRVAAEILRSRGFDQAPVVDATELLGIVRTASLAGAATVEEVREPIRAEELVSADAPVSQLLAWLISMPCLYVLDGRRITGFVLEADLNKQPARLYFYLLIANLELGLAQRLRSLSAADEARLIGAMSDDMATKLQALREAGRTDDADADLVAYMTFSEILRLAGRIDEIRGPLGFATRKDWDSTKSLIELRNAVMHPAKELVGRRCTLVRLAGLDTKLRDLLRRLDDLPTPEWTAGEP